MHTAEEILFALDDCCESFTFPMLDNGYVYLAATRLTLFRSERDWAMAIEVFGYSPRAGIPDTHIHTFASTLCNRRCREDFGDATAYKNYLVANPFNESRFIHPIKEGPWLDADQVAQDARTLVIRARKMLLPAARAYKRYGIELLEERPYVFELCRYLAAVKRDLVLATPKELRANVPPGLKQILQLDEWHHPDLVTEERPSGSKTFQQLAKVLETGDVKAYRPKVRPNTHWKNWPEGGTL